MENENFRGSSPEDKERFYRFTKLGYTVGRIDDEVYHLEHREVTILTKFGSGQSLHEENFELWERIQKMNNDQLLEYYSSQDYLNKYGENKMNWGVVTFLLGLKYLLVSTICKRYSN